MHYTCGSHCLTFRYPVVNGYLSAVVIIFDQWSIMPKRPISKYMHIIFAVYLHIDVRWMLFLFVGGWGIFCMDLLETFLKTFFLPQIGEMHWSDDSLWLMQCFNMLMQHVFQGCCALQTLGVSALLTLIYTLIFHMIGDKIQSSECVSFHIYHIIRHF